MYEQHIDYSLLHPGATIGYRLKPSDRPLQPNKIWKGRVIRWLGGTFLLVELLEPRYHNLTEPVKIDQIVAVSDEE